jgi:hypothetical protein
MTEKEKESQKRHTTDITKNREAIVPKKISFGRCERKISQSG